MGDRTATVPRLARRNEATDDGSLSPDGIEAYQHLVDHLTVNDPEEPVDAIFCFGSRDVAVPARAAALHAAGIAPLVVVSGGRPPGGERSEAEVFAGVLVDLGVPPDRVVEERCSRHTGENVVMGLAALSRHGSAPRRLAAVSWPLAARRCLATIAHHRPELATIAVPALHERPFRQVATIRTARRALAEWDRLVTYAANGMIAATVAPNSLHVATRHLRAELEHRGGAAASGGSAGSLSSVPERSDHPTLARIEPRG